MVLKKNTYFLWFFVVLYISKIPNSKDFLIKPIDVNISQNTMTFLVFVYFVARLENVNDFLRKPVCYVRQRWKNAIFFEFFVCFSIIFQNSTDFLRKYVMYFGFFNVFFHTIMNCLLLFDHCQNITGFLTKHIDILVF